ncbi:hypothetical protein BDV27DRAFT_162887 [Aspergillus caelatus]|uniref:Restriction endonuclease domain-containing protein n=1 Tax=Aspergillus caelatus TaxID=61420 RepID=A0A5N6ZPM0_9EURO|nr:uncharacterized protein BDV27DRAFT_162887 [Aspergillus caelatus]KAE8359163.1 hypothetical protein BDV27DRAFT_162887 [Aspergillus caelatus]
MSEPVNMHLTARIQFLLNKAGWGSIQVTLDEFNEVEHFLEDETKHIKYTYNSFTGILCFRMPTWMHESAITWMNRWAMQMVLLGDVDLKSLGVCTNVTLRNFQGRYLQSQKIPNVFVIPKVPATSNNNTIWPTIALEIGYSESFDALKQDADLLLQGSEGRIKTVILVKLEPLKEDETIIQAGFVEVHVFDPNSGQRRKRGRSMTLYPPPHNRAHQGIRLEWEDILRDQLNLHLSESERPPPLMLDDLREQIEDYTMRHLLQREQETDIPTDGGTTENDEDDDSEDDGS